MSTEESVARLDEWQELLLKLQVEYGGDDDAGNLLSVTCHNNDNSTPAFPVGPTRRRANQRRQDFIKSKKRARKWTPPAFDSHLYTVFKPNKYIEKLRLQSQSTTNMAGRKKAITNGKKEGNDDCDFSFNNEEGGEGIDLDNVTKKMNTMKINHQKGGGGGGGGGGALKGRYVTASKRIQLKMGYNHGPSMFVSLNPSRRSDDGTKNLRALHIKIPLLHGDDAKHVSPTS